MYNKYKHEGGRSTMGQMPIACFIRRSKPPKANGNNGAPQLPRLLKWLIQQLNLFLLISKGYSDRAVKITRFFCNDINLQVCFSL